MRTRTLVAISIAGFAFALWLARGGDPPSSSAETPPAATPTTSARMAPRLVRPTAASSAATAAAPAVRKLNPKSERYAHRMDDQVPQRLYAMASRCYKGGSGRDQRLDVTYKIRVSDGAVSIGDVRVVESTLSDPQLERCVLGTIGNATWRDDELPDVQEEGDLFMRVEGFSSYLANAEADEADGAGGDTMN